MNRLVFDLTDLWLKSMMKCASGHAQFYGNLDIKTLGGAGFASQRTAAEDLRWNLSDYDGIQMEIAGADLKRYTLILKSELLPKNPDNGREQATTAYEYDFTVSMEEEEVNTLIMKVPWSHLKATYRGREMKDAPPLNRKSIKQMSLMNRRSVWADSKHQVLLTLHHSFFGDQEGPFTLTINSIAAYRESDKQASEMSAPYKDHPNTSKLVDEKAVHNKSVDQSQGMLSWFFSCF